MASHNIPNRPAGTDTRSIADILANFDYITNLTEGLAEGTAFDPGAIDTASLANIAIKASKLDIVFLSTQKTLNLTAGSNYTFAEISIPDPGTYLILCYCNQSILSAGTHGSSIVLNNTSGSVTWSPPDNDKAPRFVGITQSVQNNSSTIMVGGLAKVTSGPANIRTTLTAGATFTALGWMIVFGFKD